MFHDHDNGCKHFNIDLGAPNLLNQYSEEKSIFNIQPGEFYGQKSLRNITDYLGILKLV